jgi:hypothetical protein
MPTFDHGRSTKVWVDGYDLSTYLRTATAPYNAGELDTTTYGNGGEKSFQKDNSDSTVSLSGFWRDTTLEPVETILNNAGVITIAPAGAVLNSAARLAYVFGTKTETPADAGDLIQQSADYRARDGVGRGRLIRIPTPISGGGNSTSVDFGAASLNYWKSALHLTAIDAGTFTATLQHSSDNTVWVAAGVFTALTAKGGAYLSGSGRLERYRRILYTFAGGTSADFVASLASQ